MREWTGKATKFVVELWLILSTELEFSLNGFASRGLFLFLFFFFPIIENRTLGDGSKRMVWGEGCRDSSRVQWCGGNRENDVATDGSTGGGCFLVWGTTQGNGESEPMGLWHVSRQKILLLLHKALNAILLNHSITHFVITKFTWPSPPTPCSIPSGALLRSSPRLLGLVRDGSGLVEGWYGATAFPNRAFDSRETRSYGGSCQPSPSHLSFFLLGANFSTYIYLYIYWLIYKNVAFVW